MRKNQLVLLCWFLGIAFCITATSNIVEPYFEYTPSYVSPFTDEERKEGMKFQYDNPSVDKVCEQLNSGEILLDDIPKSIQWVKEAC